MGVPFSEYGVGPAHLSVTRILSMIEGQAPYPSILRSTTGFFFQKEELTYLVTNRHVVINEKKVYFPDYLRISIHNNREMLGDVRHININLYEEGEPTWVEHSINQELDVVAIQINDYLDGNEIINTINESHFPRPREQINLVENMVLVGYPLGFFDKVNFIPIVRNCTFSSPYGSDFEGQPCFLINAKLHEGTSGSPVIVPVTQHIVFEEGLGQPHLGITWFLGVLSDKFTPHGIDLEVGKVWYYYHVAEIIDSGRIGQIRALRVPRAARTQII